MNTKEIYILWDHSHLWGLMALHTLTAFGARCRLVSGNEIAHGALSRKQPGILFVPGGSARQKFIALGGEGREYIREWVKSGGVYIGICGGAGLALEHPEGLGLCPWKRRNFPERLHHLFSGHVRAALKDGKILLPIWWPGRFDPECGDVEVLAVYDLPGPDLWLGDAPFANKWHGIPARLEETAFPVDQPLALGGRFGKGAYILSYAHPETPQSAEANMWLCAILGEHGISLKSGDYPWPVLEGVNHGECMAAAGYARLYGMLGLDREGSPFFLRSSWLLGWRPGAPGIACNNLLACLDFLASHACAKAFPAEKLAFFLDQAAGFFNAFRNIPAPAQENGRFLAERSRIFGHPMLGGGIADSLLADLAEAIMDCHDPDIAGSWAASRPEDQAGAPRAARSGRHEPEQVPRSCLRPAPQPGRGSA